MNVLIVGNVLKDVYLNLDSRTENFEIDQNNIKWLDLSFNASEHHFFSRNSSLGGAAVSLEVLQKLKINATISSSNLDFSKEEVKLHNYTPVHRYILVSDGSVSYLSPSKFQKTVFTPPDKPVDYIYIDRSSEINSEEAHKISTYLNNFPETKLIIYLRNLKNYHLNQLLPKANLIFHEKTQDNLDRLYSSKLEKVPPEKIVSITENQISYLNIKESIYPSRIDISTHLSFYSIIAATVLGSFILGMSVETSLKMAKVNAENSKLDATLSILELNHIIENSTQEEDIELIAASLMIPQKGILAADESGGSIKKKFSQLSIPDTYQNRRDYRNIFLSTPNLAKYINGVILFEETTIQSADNGQNFVDYLISKRIIPGIKVDQGLEKFPNSIETYTKGLDGLAERLKKYRTHGIRFAKWRAAFDLKVNQSNQVITPTQKAIIENCKILAEYAKACQLSGLVPIVEPELVYNGYYTIEKCAEVTGNILDTLFRQLKQLNINLRACILKVNMIMAGKNSVSQSTPEEVGSETAKILKAHVPKNLAGVVFLSGGQTPEQATKNLAEIIKNGPFDWPVTFSFARALQDPALYAWAGDNNNANQAQQAFLDRLIKNTNALKN